MAGTACKFVVIQYMPDEIKQEIFNIGVILHCPEKGILKARFLKNYQKLNKLITVNQINEFRHFRNNLNRHFKSLDGHMLDSKLDIPITFEFLDSLVYKNFNKFQIKNPTPLLAEDPYEKLDDLFNFYVFEEDYLEKRDQPLVSSVWHKFKQAGVDSFIRKDVDIPNFPFPIDYGFQNGSANLIQTIKFTDNSKDNFKEGLLWRDALLIKEKVEQYKESPFYAVVKPPTNPQKFGYSLALEQFQEYQNVEVIEFGTNKFSGLVEHIKEHGHILH
ncbi:DUF3037 domain-containing protein [Peribacillus sp. NPDC046944]|uniref:DUF3037 domain-containing protein n=1 Tax=unclassified Peribacillus TaxID=2675266 RepID=UPI003CFD051F